MAWYDSFTDLFSSTPVADSPEQTPLIDTSPLRPTPSESAETAQRSWASGASPKVQAFSPQTMLSIHYSLANLCVTTKALSQPNLPSTDAEFYNLQLLADMLERLDSEIGPFQILSGFRTKELQAALSASGEPTASGTSFHELGRAVDIYPTTMSIADYFGRILANENLKSQFAEIAIKPGQNSLHLAINTPGDLRTPKVLGLNSEGVYAKLSLDEITKYIEPFMQSAEQAYDYAAAQLVTYNRTPLILGAVAALGGAAFLIISSKKRTT